MTDLLMWPNNRLSFLKLWKEFYFEKYPRTLYIFFSYTSLRGWANLWCVCLSPVATICMRHTVIRGFLASVPSVTSTFPLYSIQTTICFGSPHFPTRNVLSKLCSSVFSAFLLPQNRWLWFICADLGRERAHINRLTRCHHYHKSHTNHTLAPVS